MGHWITTFGAFEENWDHQFSVERHPFRTENFSFVYKRTLYIGLNLVGGSIASGEVWDMELEEQFDWVKSLIETHVVKSPSDALSIVIFGHAFPRNRHSPFFDPLREYVEKELANDVPILYLNGDKHVFDFEESFMDQPSFHRLQVEGGSRDPPLQVNVKIREHTDLLVEDVFSYDRMKE